MASQCKDANHDTVVVCIELTHGSMTGTVKFNDIEEVQIIRNVLDDCDVLQTEVFKSGILGLTWHEEVFKEQGVFHVPSVIHLIRVFTEDMVNEGNFWLESGENDSFPSQSGKNLKIDCEPPTTKLSKILDLCFMILHHFSPNMDPIERESISDDINWMKKTRSMHLNNGEIGRNWHKFFCKFCEGDCMWVQLDLSTPQNKMKRKVKDQDKKFDDYKKVCVSEKQPTKTFMAADHDPWNYTGPEPPWANSDVDWSKLPWRDMLIRPIPSHELPWRDEDGAWGGADVDIDAEVKSDVDFDVGQDIGNTTPPAHYADSVEQRFCELTELHGINDDESPVNPYICDMWDTECAD
ncbi:uncharacterized protein LOC119662736 [Teleopsis dalmanni]|uniref:uncharacterized protein LOC119662736 n=1 Tax=Teleopsis dalmanni TaxID=139649 RepID=UPI0018CCF17D|nr:uncharacterized protein LOC119662736 [Teleopsis dalmanni]